MTPKIDPGMQAMMGGILQGIIGELTQGKPANDSIKEQANVLAVYLTNIPTVKEGMNGILNAKTIAKILYNLSQEDFDKLYEAFESAKKYRRVL